jgi:hypothetical protein
MRARVGQNLSLFFSSHLSFLLSVQLSAQLSAQLSMQIFVSVASVAVVASACSPATSDDNEDDNEELAGGEGEGEGENQAEECDLLDPVLGSAVLSSDVVVVDSTVSPVDAASFLAMATFEAVAGGTTILLLQGDMSVLEVGSWPTLSTAEPTVRDLAEDRFSAATDYPSSFLVATPEHVAAGWTGSDGSGGFTGTLAVQDRTTGDNRFVAAPGLTHAALVQDHLLVTGLGLGDLAFTAPHIYGLPSLSAGEAVDVVAFGEDQASGYVVALPSGGALLGSFDLTTFDNVFFGADEYDIQLSFFDPPVRMVLGSSLFSSGATLQAVSFGDGAALVLADANFAPVAVRYQPATSSSAGTPSSILTLTNACTALGAVAAIGAGDLLVVLDHAQGEDRIVRLALVR